MENPIQQFATILINDLEFNSSEEIEQDSFEIFFNKLQAAGNQLPLLLGHILISPELQNIAEQLKTTPDTISKLIQSSIHKALTKTQEESQRTPEKPIVNLKRYLASKDIAFNSIILPMLIDKDPKNKLEDFYDFALTEIHKISNNYQLPNNHIEIVIEITEDLINEINKELSTHTGNKNLQEDIIKYIIKSRSSQRDSITQIPISFNISKKIKFSCKVLANLLDTLPDSHRLNTEWESIIRNLSREQHETPTLDETTSAQLIQRVKESQPDYTRTPTRPAQPVPHSSSKTKE